MSYLIEDYNLGESERRVMGATEEKEWGEKRKRGNQKREGEIEAGESVSYLICVRRAPPNRRV